jgi:hypothetical protein
MKMTSCSTLLAAFLGCLLAISAGIAIFLAVLAVRLSLARRMGRMATRQVRATAGWPFDADGQASEDSARPGDPTQPDPGDRLLRSRRPTERLPDEWTDDWGRSEAQTQDNGRWTQARPGSVWAIDVVPAGGLATIPARGDVFVGSEEDDVRVGVPRTGEFRGGEIEVDAGCADSFAICDVLVRGESQLWGSAGQRRSGEIPAESFAREPYGVIAMRPAGPEDEIEIVVRNTGKRMSEFRAMIRGEYRAQES